MGLFGSCTGYIVIRRVLWRRGCVYTYIYIYMYAFGLGNNANQMEHEMDTGPGIGMENEMETGVLLCFGGCPKHKRDLLILGLDVSQILLLLYTALSPKP